MVSIQQIADWCGAQVANSDEEGIAALLHSLKIENLSPLETAGPQDLAFFFSRNYEEELKKTRAGVIITGDAFVAPLKASGLPQWKTSVFLTCAEPYQAMAKVTRELSKFQSAHDHQLKRRTSEIHPTAIVDASVKLGERVKIGPHVVIEAGVVIGNDVTLYPSVYLGPRSQVGDESVLFPRVSLYEGTVIGKRCRLHAGVVVGADGFGYAQEKDPVTKLPVNHLKVYHLGRVLIGDDVEVGANSTIDRGTFGDTVIHDKVKIDNQVQVGHNATLEEGAILCGCAGIAGSATVGKFTIVGAQAGVSNQVKIGAYSMLTGYTGVTKDFPEHSAISGYPGRPQSEYFKMIALQLKMLKERGRKK
jgi:UDP-3-O-[3-hydroxymyristoyl] glucosamine N-acyltransferase